jgi:hypothetical protein
VVNRSPRLAEQQQKATGERFGIFVGLWAPTFMALGNGIANLPDKK